MDERNRLIELYEIYKDLLTEKQREYFENYYYEDLSLSEIASNENVSRAIVSKTVNIVVKRIKEFENVLNINKMNNKIKEILKIDEIEKVKCELEKLLK